MVENPDEIVVFQHYDNAIDAHIAKSKLDAYGIPCFLTEENMANLYPGQSLYAFKMRLHIFATDRERAMQVLASRNLSIHGDASLACPRCQSHRVERAFPRKEADNLIFILFGVFLPQKKVSHCLDCDHEFS
jgi:hypothetical protein